ncbi:MAG TPA: hypothetical protein VN695_16420 [Streptosporangiaceae bacterium]|nr:hypothetical protein [Streptosporangiaceae bacterium]
MGDAHAGPPSDNGAAAKNGAAAATGSTDAPGVASSVAANSADPGSGPAGPALNGHAGQRTEQADRPARKWTATVMLTLAEETVRRHWLASALIAVGLVLRVLAQAAYQPAIVYIDTLKYLYDAWPGSDPVGYKIPLKMILALGGNLNTVELVQHLLGIAIAITMYVVLIRRGTPRWLAALAMVPVLFDAYQLQAEAMIMPDVWFEALIVAGLAVLLWQKRPTLQTLIIGAALLGGSTGVRQVGEIMIVPAVVIAIVLGGGLRKVLVNTTAVICAFALAIVLYMGASYELTHHFRISYSQSSLTYGRMAGAADCATLNVSPIVKLLCPTAFEKAQGPDWLEHSGQGPLRTFGNKLPITLQPDRAVFISQFNRAVEKQQSLRVIGAVLRDSVKLFALTRETSPGDTPIWRWQFHGYFPVFGQYVSLKNNLLYIKLPHKLPRPLAAAYGGRPQVDVPIARFLRSYQIHGGYTPGPLLALCVLAGLIGSALLAFRRRMTPQARELGVACITFFAAAVAVLGISDAFEFSWRYQLPGLVTLPAAGALGIAAIMVFFRRRSEPAAPQTVSERAPEPASAQ